MIKVWMLIFITFPSTEVYSGSGSSTEEDIAVQFLSRRKFNSDDSDQNYDSDKDPVWMPFDVVSSKPESFQ